MNSTERKFVNFIGEYAFGEKQLKNYDNLNYETIDWTALLDLAKTHNVEAIIYTSLIKNKLIDNINKIRIDNLLNKRNSNVEKESSSLNLILEILNNFHSENISVIPIKGLFEKEFYKIPQNRISNKIQLLAHKDDIDKIIKIFTNYEFDFKYNEDGSKLIFIHTNCCPIEVISNFYKVNNNISMINKLQRDVWTSITEKSFNNILLLSLNNEYRLLFLAMSMADDFREDKLCFMDICDFALLLNEINDSLNWDSFFIKSSIVYIEKFLLALFLTCKEFFNIKIPKELNTNSIYNSKYINSFIDKILNPPVDSNLHLSNKDILLTPQKSVESSKLSIFNIFKKNHGSVSSEQLIAWLELQYK